MSGYQGDYFNNRDLAGSPVCSYASGSLAFDWTSSGPGCGIGTINWSARWTKNDYFAGGTYRFFSTVDDGVRVYVDNNLVVDAWRIGPALSTFGDVYLTPGYHTIRVEYFQAEGVAVLYFKYARL